MQNRSNQVNELDQPRELQFLTELQHARDSVHAQVGKVIVGHREVIDQILISMFSGGHVLLVGVPGLAKTLLVRTIADSLSLDFNRIQFTPDLMPSDITGTEVIQQDVASGERALQFHRGPIFANMILADEINRTPPKTQAAMLEAMQERQVTVGGKKHVLGNPFMVLATQNPIEQEGTYPLPEALMDRFMFQIRIRYPSEFDELEIVRRTTSTTDSEITPVLSGEKIVELSKLICRIPIADHIALYALRLARLTRLGHEDAGEQELGSKKSQQEIKEYIHAYVRWGAGPRASQYLVLAGKALAVLHGRALVTHEDIRNVAAPVLRHRIRINFLAGAEQISPDKIIARLIEYLDEIDDKAQSGIDSKLFRTTDVG